ncbi:MAG: arginine--tRNA ligase [Candidatus Korarchaeota archaeon]|nr:arginine--tRNA ligase [Candidatus Korarchaeota archaeon]
MTTDPLGSLKSALAHEVNRSLSELGSSLKFNSLQVARSPKEKDMFGLPVGFKAAKELKKRPDEAVKLVAEKIDLEKVPYAVSVVTAGGYLNVMVDRDSLFADVLKLASEERLGMGASKGTTVMVEHTSVNPVHPLHVGSGRNAIIGDSFARILHYLGWDVRRHYLVNDCNLQVAILAAGRSKIKDLEPKGKIDHWYGLIYAMANAVLEIWKIRHGLSEEEEVLKEWEETIERVRSQDPRVAEGVGELTEDYVMDLLKRYQRGDPEAKLLFREVAESVLKGFRETLGRMGITYDQFDWESELIWNSWVSKALEKLEASGYLGRDGDAIYVDLGRAVREREDIRRIFGLSKEKIEELEAEGRLEEVVPSRFYLTRSDGTWLYTGTDVAYSLFKVETAEVERCYNVIATEQTLEQREVRASLALMGYDPDFLIHFAYEMVNLIGIRMSGRRALYITLDGLLDEAKSKVKEILARRGLREDEEMEEISEKVAIGALKYALINVSPTKVVQFKWERVLDFETNSGPFVQYSYTRAHSILRKAGQLPGSFDPSNLKLDLEVELVYTLAGFPERVQSAYSLLRPDLISQYANDLASTFNKFYESHPVLIAPSGIREARLWLVSGVKGVLGKALDLIGVPRLEKM